jgi:hypothetical protein
LYLGSFIIGVGFCLALYQRPLPWSVVILWLGYTIGFGLLYPAKSRAEEGELAEALGEPYISYARRVPAFIPWRGRVSGLGPQTFSRELYQRNREYQCWLGSAAVLAFLFTRYALAR